LSSSIGFSYSPAGVVANWSGVLNSSYSNLTAELWVNGAATPGWGESYILTSYDTPGLGTVWIFQAESPKFLDGDWHHVAKVWDQTAGEIRLYVDGVEGIPYEASYSAATIGAAGLYIGGGHTGDGNYYNGSVQGLRVSDEVRYSSNFIPPTSYTSDSATLLFLPLTEGDPALVTDEGPYGIGVTARSTAFNSIPGPFCQSIGASSSYPGLSCLDILNANASTGDGTYWIDPDGTGAFEAYCDMTTDGGGWTRVLYSDFSNGVDGWSATGTCGTFSTSYCGARGDILGGYGISGIGAKFNRSVDALSVTHSAARVVFDAISGDSWDPVTGGGPEYFQITFDGWASTQTTPGSGGSTGDVASFVPGTQTNECGAGWNDEVIALEYQFAHTASNLEFGLGNTLDSGCTNEWMGLDNFQAFLR
jgi:hypothetical protein